MLAYNSFILEFKRKSAFEKCIIKDSNALKFLYSARSAALIYLASPDADKARLKIT